MGATPFSRFRRMYVKRDVVTFTDDRALHRNMLPDPVAVTVKCHIILRPFVCSTFLLPLYDCLECFAPALRLLLTAFWPLFVASFLVAAFQRNCIFVSFFIQQAHVDATADPCIPAMAVRKKRTWLARAVWASVDRGAIFIHTLSYTPEMETDVLTLIGITRVILAVREI